MKNISLIIKLLFAIILPLIKIGASDDKDLPVGNHLTPQPLTQISPAQDSFCTLLDCIQVSPENYKECSPQLLDFIHTLTLSSKACLLLGEVKNKYGFIELCFPAELPSSARWIPHLKKIEIERRYVNNTEQFCQFLIFELCNAANKIFNVPIFQISENPDVYAFLCESAEYLSCLRNDEIVADYFCISNYHIELRDLLEKSSSEKIDEIIYESINTLSYNFENLMDCWSVANQKVKMGRPIHSDTYRDAYRRIISSQENRRNILREGLDKYNAYELSDYIAEFVYAKPEEPLSDETREFCREVYEQHKKWMINFYKGELDKTSEEFNHFPNIEGDGEFLIVYTYSQKSFDLAKKETRSLKAYETHENPGRLTLRLVRPTFLMPSFCPLLNIRQQGRIAASGSGVMGKRPLHSEAG